MKFRYGKSRYEKSRYQISLYKNLAMKKSRYDPKNIAMKKNLAMTLKSRYEKISLWTRNLAMKKSRYGKISPWKNLAMKLCYRLSTYALHLRISPFCQFAFAYFSSYVFRSTLWRHASLHV